MLEIRDCKDAYHLDECGFEYRSHTTWVCGIFGDEPTIRDVAANKTEADKFLAKEFGAAKVVCYDLRVKDFWWFSYNC